MCVCMCVCVCAVKSVRHDQSLFENRTKRLSKFFQELKFRVFTPNLFSEKKVPIQKKISVKTFLFLAFLILLNGLTSELSSAAAKKAEAEGLGVCIIK